MYSIFTYMNIENPVSITNSLIWPKRKIVLVLRKLQFPPSISKRVSFMEASVLHFVLQGSN